MTNLDEFLLKNENKIPSNAVLLIVCNTKSKTQTLSNYRNFSINTEFLSDEELIEITNMAGKLNLPFRIFYDEKVFIDTILATENLCVNNYIVYNSAQNGIGPGRKALIPSICKYFSLRYTGSDAYRVCLCRDKFAINSILSANSIAAPISFLYSGEEIPRLKNDVTYIAKPLYESSSLGITNDNIFLGNKFPKSFLDRLINNMQQSLLIQEFIDGYEIEVPVLIGKCSAYAFSPVVLHSQKNNLTMDGKILDYEKIYNDNYYFSSLPKYIDEKNIRNTAERVANLLGLRGLCRVDFRLRKNNTYFVTDVSTNPHFVNHSSVNFAFRQLGKENWEILQTILRLS
jgi:D-alanine-D-alanine ligase